MAALHQGFVGLGHVFLIRRSSVGVVQGSSGLDQLQQHTMIDCCSLQAAKKLRCNKRRSRAPSAATPQRQSVRPTGRGI
ncbi:hypothetical protein ALO54_102375 [Pseudomonas syringae pv. philadelphi]|nr:hypothetical protein ALO86_102118 [Pseudomonas syringae pv. berberidis]KPY23513.1 hypothetical protein ALO54_102375 [Pseudomonas syringae pv. philadelphi]RMM16221.1 hypothetical protein ALQ83_102435 [Pseudomonas syringae pv. berberidis]RMP58793.1 hypothetical protein ALQ19_102425 [Pseudomonas syringae pv. berberidis]RMQ42590.1 hypothetical protein ALQ06_102350 [Pseudomonas syringae pv. berberidis]